MRRREFITLLGSMAVARPRVARAQQPSMPVIGLLMSAWPNDSAHLVTALRRGLNEAGYADGQNVSIEYHWAENQYDRLPALAADLARRQLAVIVAGGNAAALAAKAATATIPVVFATGNEPVQLGLVPNINAPTGNVTGATYFSNTLEPKRVELLTRLMPNIGTIAYLSSANDPNSEFSMKLAQSAVESLGRQIRMLKAKTHGELEPAFAMLARERADALLIGADEIFYSWREQLVALAARHAIPTAYSQREFVEVGGLMSYGTSAADAFRQAGISVGRILQGAKPADLPVIQSSKFELMINLRTARALGLTVPLALQVAADEVIE